MNYYFLGIGGIGMSAIARFFHQRGDTVSGYDRTESPLTRQLVQEGIAVHYDDDPSQIPDAIDLVVYTPAVPKETAEFQYLLQKKSPCKNGHRCWASLPVARNVLQWLVPTARPPRRA